MLFNSVQEYFKGLESLLAVTLVVILVSKDAREELINIWENL